MNKHYPSFWQDDRGLARLLAPLGGLYCRVSAYRRQRRARVAQTLAIPVVVVGNISVGGTGKTPVVLALLKALRERGFNPGVVSRGFGGRPGKSPLLVNAQTPVHRCGDEPYLLHQRSGVPVAVHPDRVAAAQNLLQHHPDMDVIVADDGFQHHRLARCVDWVLIDAKRKLGNQRCLPAGPLREHPKALADADAVLINGVTDWRPAFGPEPWQIQFELTQAQDLADQSSISLARLAQDSERTNTLAAAGIGHPACFFQALTDAGITLAQVCALGDHQAIEQDRLQQWLAQYPRVLITEKDAVKMPAIPLTPGQLYSVRGQITLPEALLDTLIARIGA